MRGVLFLVSKNVYILNAKSALHSLVALSRRVSRAEGRLEGVVELREREASLACVITK